MHGPYTNAWSAHGQRMLCFSQVSERASRPAATEAELAEGAALISVFGKPQWLEPSAAAKSALLGATLPGMVAYATAADASRVLYAAASGAVLSPTLLADAMRSRKPPSSAFSTPATMPPFLAAFNDAEWGLGIQLVRAPAPTGAGSTQAPPLCWGHVGANGSFSLVIPGLRPLVATFLVNRTGGERAAQRVLGALVNVAVAAAGHA